MDADGEDLHEALLAEQAQAVAAFEPLKERLRRLTGRLIEARGEDLEFGDLASDLRAGDLAELVDVLVAGVSVLSDHEKAVRAADLYLGGFWYEAFSLSTKAAPAVVQLLSRARVRTFALALVEAFSYTYADLLDVMKRGDAAVRSVLWAARDPALEELVLAYAATVTADYRELVHQMLPDSTTL